jgi:hypothetical protein
MFAEPQHKNAAQQQSPVTIQPKLEIGAKDDAHEKEADAIAGKVMRMPEKNSGGENPNNKAQLNFTPGPKANVPSLHLKKEEEEKVHMKTEEVPAVKAHFPNGNGVRLKSESQTIRRNADTNSGGPLAAPAHVESGIAQSKGGGQSLPENVQKDIGGKMGADLSDVKIHTDSNAHNMSSDINAKAFTHGSDIYFKQGNYNTTSDSGKELLTHELVHTQQQKGGVQRKIQRNWLGDLYDMTIGDSVQTVTDLYHYASDTPEQYNKYIQAKLLHEMDYWNSNPEPSLGFKIAYYASMGIAGALFPFGISIFPSIESLWSLIVRGKQGYYEYLYHLDPSVPEKKDGALSSGAAGKTISSVKSAPKSNTSPTTTTKTAGAPKTSPVATPATGKTAVTTPADPDHVPQKKLVGGYAKVIDHQMKNLVDPMFAWGEVKGLFKGIGGWFTDIWDAIVWLVESVGSLISGAYNWAAKGKTPEWLVSLKNMGMKAWDFLSKNGSEMLKGLQKAMSSPGGELTKSLGNMKANMLKGAGNKAYEKGRGMAASQVEIMSMSAEDQGEKVGYVIGYLIPEILLMIFSGSIGNWVKGGLEALSKFRLVMKAMRIWEKIVEAGRWLMESLGKMWKGIKTFFSSTFGKAFDDILEFFRGFVEHGDDMAKLEKNAVKDEKFLEEGSEHLDDGKKGPKENKGKEEPDKKDPEKKQLDADKAKALLYAETILKANKASDGAVLSLMGELKVLDWSMEVIKDFEYEQVGEDLEVYMIASRTKVGSKKVKKKKLRDEYLGDTPGKSSRTGRDVIERMNEENKIRTRQGRRQFRSAEDGKWYDIDLADMSHKNDAVSWWNRIGRKYGAKSDKVRKWMLDAENYYLEHQTYNRSSGAMIGETYKPPLK